MKKKYEKPSGVKRVAKKPLSVLLTILHISQDVFLFYTPLVIKHGNKHFFFIKKKKDNIKHPTTPSY